MNRQFMAHIPAIQGDRGHVYEAHDVLCVCDDVGHWTMDVGGYGADSVLESDVIDKCSKASNWQAIRAEYFPMDGFFAGGEIVDRTPESKTDY